MKSLRAIVRCLGFYFLFTFLVVSPALAQPRFEPHHLRSALAAQQRYTKDLLGIDGVVGTAVGMEQSGQAVVKIYAEKEGIGGLPQVLDGVSVVVEITGKIYPLKRGQGGGGHGGRIDPKSQFDQPVPLGVSSGINQVETVGLFLTCTSGTLGARLKSGNNYYALSNNHVYALSSDGSTSIDPSVEIVQPGLADTRCASSGNVIGDHIQFVPLNFLENDPNSTNTVDAAIALSSSSQVKNIFWDNQAVPNAQIHAVTSDDVDVLAVRKYGAASGLTIGKVTGLNATFKISYGTGKTAYFTNQIEFSGCKGACIKGGDSGSLLITNDGIYNPVGLLFAGDQSGKTAWANPIADVKSQLEAQGAGTLTFE